MLGLKSFKNPKWAKIVATNLGVFLADHAFEEQKAAAGRFSSIIAYSVAIEHSKLLRTYQDKIPLVHE
ncbi:MAG: hypothetical protein JKY16_01695 [Lutibacter sp.]|nr:hypothetical protein [Lutibacter sp.]